MQLMVVKSSIGKETKPKPHQASVVKSECSGKCLFDLTMCYKIFCFQSSSLLLPHSVNVEVPVFPMAPNHPLVTLITSTSSITVVDANITVLVLDTWTQTVSFQERYHCCQTQMISYTLQLFLRTAPQLRLAFYVF